MKQLTDFELSIMRKLWGAGKATPEEIKRLFEEEGRRMTGGTVRKMLGILIEKGYVSREKAGKTYLYHPVVTGESATTLLVKDVIDRAFDGSISHMFASFLDNETVSEDDLETIALLIEKHRKESGR